MNASVLRGANILTLGQGHRLYDQVRDLASRHGGVLREDYEGTSLDTLRQMVAMDMGISVMPELYIRSEMERETAVVARTLPVEGMDRPIGLCWRKGAARRNHFEALAAFLTGVSLDVFGDLYERRRQAAAS